MFGYLVLLFTVLPALELMLLIKIGSSIGAINTLFIIVFTGVLGAYLARLQGFVILNKIQTQMAQGKMPTSEMLDGLMIFVGGLVLLTPGFVTDTIGFLLLIPFTRALIKMLVKSRFEAMVKNGQNVSFTSFGAAQQGKEFRSDDGVIDVDGKSS